MFVTNRYVVFVAIVFLSLALWGCNQKSEHLETEKIISEYIKFQNDMGSKEIEECLKLIPDIFTEDVVKIVDDRHMAHGLDALANHCSELRKMYETWYVDLKDVQLSDDKKSATLKYQIVSEKAGIFEVVTILKFSKDRKIKEFNEAYYRLDANQYD